MNKPLPHPDDVIDALMWLRLGCPALHRDFPAEKQIKTLLQLINALPTHLPVYAHGSDENKAARKLNE